MKKPKIKICGITSAINAKILPYNYIDAIGLVFYKKSKRCIDIKSAQNIIDVIPPFVNIVGLFVNNTAKEVF